MQKLNTKLLMMDAGMRLFESNDNFGSTIGQVKAEMEVYGNVLKTSELDNITLPATTGECDLFLNWSSLWRTRYISCHVESAGDFERDGEAVHRYAASFREGNASTLFRDTIMFIIIALSISAMIFGHSVFITLAAIAAILATGYFWIMPSSKASRIVEKIMESVADIQKEGQQNR